jgi:hypothetical protein
MEQKRKSVQVTKDKQGSPKPQCRCGSTKHSKTTYTKKRIKILSPTTPMPCYDGRPMPLPLLTAAEAMHAPMATAEKTDHPLSPKAPTLL